MNKIKGLDTLRFFAFFVIFIFHATPYFNFGYLGVDFFFVLSSFLLSYLAFHEIEKTNSFSRLNFFIRRALRIFPLYYLVIIFSFGIIPLLDPSATLPENKLFYWIFLSNYEYSDCIYSLKFLWSIALEEQFYLIFIGLSCLLRRNVLLLIAVLMLSYFVFMHFAFKLNISIYSNTITHFPNFSAGIIGGYFYYQKINFRFLHFLLLILSFAGTFFINNEVLSNINVSVLFLSLMFVFMQLSKHISGLWLFKLTEKLGGYTYGLYVYSGFVLTIVPRIFKVNNPYLQLSLEFFILVFVSILSYHLYEARFLKFKKYFRK